MNNFVGMQRQVIKTRSVKYMPFWLSVTNFLNGATWTAYAAIKFDPWMVVCFRFRLLMMVNVLYIWIFSNLIN